MTSSHSKFLRQWDRLIDLEAKETEVWSLFSFCLEIYFNQFTSLKSLFCFFYFSPLPFQILRKEVWQSHSSKSSNNSGLSSIVLDDSVGIPLEKSSKDNQFTYRFIQQDSSSNLSEVSTVSSSASLKNDLDFTLRSGDHVVCILSYFYFGNNWI